MCSRAAQRGSSEHAEALGMWREAEDHFRRALDLGAANRSDLYAMVAQGRIALDDEDGAQEALTRAVQSDPTDATTDEAWRLFLRFAHTFGRYPAVVETVQRRLDLLRDSPNADPAVAGKLFNVQEFAAEIARAAVEPVPADHTRLVGDTADFEG